VSFLLVLWGAGILLDQALKIWVFPHSDHPDISYPCMPNVAPDRAGSLTCDQIAIDAQKEIQLDDYEASKQRDAAQAIAMIVLAGPVCWFYWTQARKRGEHGGRFGPDAKSQALVNKAVSLKKIYFYLVSFVSLIFVLFFVILLLDEALKVWVFPLGDQPNYSYPCATPVVVDGRAMITCNQAAIDAQRMIDTNKHIAQKPVISNGIIYIAIGFFVWWFHWTQAKKMI